jgi:hypothetical protein
VLRFTLPVCDMVRRRMRNIADLATSIIGQLELYDRLKPISRTYLSPLLRVILRATVAMIIIALVVAPVEREDAE